MSLLQSAQICVDVWGEFAMFTMPQSKVERATYKMPTPSACRGILNAIYSKPIEFCYEIQSVELINPIRLMTLRRNEVQFVADVGKAGLSGYHLYSDQMRTQRMSTYLCDVYYRIYAKLILREDAPKSVNLTSVVNQFNRRVRGGKCFYQPVLGTRECTCHFSPPDMTKKALDITEDLGIMLYDVFDIRNNIPLNTTKSTKKKPVVSCDINVSFFEAKLEHGIMKVPPYDSNKILVRRNI